MSDLSERSRTSLPTTSVGTNRGAFGWTEWGLLSGIALIWGSSFLLMAIGLDAFSPGVITMLRVALGAATLAVVPRARSPIEAQDRFRVAILGIIWIAIPLTLLPIAQQWIDSSVTGMIHGAVPILAALWATVLLRRFPGPRQLVGIGVGFVGVTAIFLPELQDSTATALGAGLALLAVTFYGLSANLVVPLQQKYGALPVLLRAQMAALLVVVPIGLLQLSSSTWAWSSALAMIPLGVLGTGFAFVFMTILVGRVGGPRGAIAIYFVPIVAIALGVIVRDEGLDPIAVVGAGLVLVGAWFASRRET